jgi:hypothetical protein
MGKCPEKIISGFVFLRRDKRKNMNNLTYTISNDRFQFKTLMSKQFMSRFQWSNEETKGRAYCSELVPGVSYNVLEFQAQSSLALNYHPKDADGLLFIINHLSSPGYVQLMTESNLMVDYTPRNVEIYIIPADKLFSFTYAAATTGKRIEFFVKTPVLTSALSPALVQLLKHKPFLPFSELLNDVLYNEFCRQFDCVFREDQENIHSGIIYSLLSVLKNFNEFADKTTLLNPLFPYKMTLNGDNNYRTHKKIA